MKKPRWMIGLAGTAGAIILIAVYLVVYIFPSMESINRHRREVKNFELKIADLGNMRVNLTFPDQRERKYFLRAERMLKRKIPQVIDSKAFDSLIENLSLYLKNLAASEGVRLDRVEVETPAGQKETGHGNEKEGLLKSHDIYLGFAGELKNAVNFINHIPWGVYYLVGSKMTISAGGDFPSYGLVLKVYYFDQFSSAGVKSGISEQVGLAVDLDSEILLDRVYYHLPGKYRKREVPTKFGIKIFVKEGRQ